MEGLHKEDFLVYCNITSGGGGLTNLLLHYIVGEGSLLRPQICIT